MIYFWLQQMGGIDEAALDKLSLVTEMTKHIQVRASSSSSKGASASEIGQYSPLFLWLLRVSFLHFYFNGLCSYWLAVDLLVYPRVGCRTFIEEQKVAFLLHGCLILHFRYCFWLTMSWVSPIGEPFFVFFHFPV